MNKLYPSNSSDKTILITALVALGITFLAIILGAFTRLVDAGLGCPDWPTCYGHLLWPNTDSEIQQANLAYPDALVETDKTWPEMAHRYFASSVGIFCIALVVLAYKARPAAPLKHTLILLVMVILQGAFGAWTVTLKLWPQVVTAHLLGGFATLSILWLLILRLKQAHWCMDGDLIGRVKSLQRFAAFCLVVVILQIALGGWTTSNYAALACPDMPTCQGQWLPPADFKDGFNILQEIGPNYLGGTMDNDARVAIHLTHRIGAVITTVLLVSLVFALLRIPYAPIKTTGLVLVAVLILQLLLGLSNVVFLLPLPVAVAHNAVGALLLLVLVTVNYLIVTVKSR